VPLAGAKTSTSQRMQAAYPDRCFDEQIAARNKALSRAEQSILGKKLEVNHRAQQGWPS